MRRRSRTRSIIATAAALAAVGGVALAAGSDRAQDHDERITITTPAGSRLTMSVTTSPTGRWCARAVLTATTDERFSHRVCGSERPARRLHGEFVADCERGELIALGALPTRTSMPGATVVRTDQGGTPVYLAVVTPGRPLRVVDEAGATVDTVDLGAWDRDCASSWFVPGSY